MTGNVRTALVVLGALVAACAVVPSCTRESIVLATIPSDDAGAAPVPQRCVDTDCPTGMFCAKQSCSDTEGTCQLVPTDCDEPEMPVCGCDSITYYNDCLRMEHGIAASTPDDCRTEDFLPCTLDGTLQCPDPTTQVCAVLVNGDKGPCPPEYPGTCWVVPGTCPTPPQGTDRFDLCDESQRCLDTCSAIRAGLPFRRADQCTPPHGG